MLRVEASNLPKPRGTPRARRLFPTPPAPRRARAESRPELLPPPQEAHSPHTELALPAQPAAPALQERWSVRLQLADDEIATLYGQGMTRGAVVWKKGMVEWRPLLITPELSGLLHRTRITSIDSPARAAERPLVGPATAAEPLSLPRPVRLPSEIGPNSAKNPVFFTISPSAMDVVAPAKRGRWLELIAVAAAAFALAWIGHGGRHPQRSGASTPPVAHAVATTPVCQPAQPSTQLGGSAIPTVAVADLPLVGATNATAKRGATALTHGGSNHPNSRSTSASGGPNRSEFLGAMSEVAQAASACGERGGPVRVVVSFANSGVARSIQVSGTDLPASTRSCVIGAASRARVPAFSGDPVTVAKTL